MGDTPIYEFKPFLCHTDSLWDTIRVAWLVPHEPTSEQWIVLTRQLSDLYREARSRGWRMESVERSWNEFGDQTLLVYEMQFHSWQCNFLALGWWDYGRTCDHVCNWFDEEAKKDWGRNTILMWKRWGCRAVFDAADVRRVLSNYNRWHKVYAAYGRTKAIFRKKGTTTG